MGAMRRGIALIAFITALSACALGPNFKRPPAPASPTYGSAPMDAELPGADSVGGATQRYVKGMDIPAQWWTLFQSPKLNHLVELALRNSADVGAAQAALRQAHELYSAQWTSLIPTVQGGVSGDRSQFPAATLSSPITAPNNIYNLFTAQLTLSYVPDLFGGTRRAIEQAHAQEVGTRFQLEATYLTLTSNVVVTAVQEASLRGQITATLRMLDLQQQLTDKVRKQRALGTASDLDVLAQEALQAQTAQTLPPLQKQLGQSRDALTALLGRLPADEPQETFELTDLNLPADLPVSVPSKLVEQRPDVRQAEENMHAASAAVGIATADLLPQFAINADLGSSALKLQNLFGAYTSFWDLGVTLSQTVFDAGALIHKRRAAIAALDQAGAQYRSAVILACQNVADTLRALRSDADSLKANNDSARAAKAAFDLAQRQKSIGTISTVAVLNAEQTYQQAELSLVQAQANRFADTAGLFQALGGGWWNRSGETKYEQFSSTGE
jgi:NodT family efflux transporter outer membrane factor (OMF) lipoprotein